MIHGQHLKKSPYKTPLFRETSSAQPFTSSSIPTWYLLLQGQQSDPHLYAYNACKYICPVFANETQNCTFVVMEGEELGDYMRSRAGEQGPLLSEDEIWSLAICVCEAFVFLADKDSAQRLTHLAQHSIRRVPAKNVYKLIYHESMVSQLQAAKAQLIPWDKLYLSPEELNSQFIPQKSIVWSLGAMLLNLCAFQDRKNVCYTADFRVDGPAIQRKLRLAKQQNGYSKLLCNFIKQCLVMDHQARYNFEELNAALRRKLERQFNQQSDLLSQVMRLQEGMNVTYDILIPEKFQYTGTGHHRAKSEQKVEQKSGIGLELQQKNFMFKSDVVDKKQQSEQPKTEVKVVKLKKKGSMKFEGSKVGKSKTQQPQQSNSKPNEPLSEEPKTSIFNFQYRGTFGSRYVHGSNEKEEYESPVRKIKSTAKKDEEQSDGGTDNERDIVKTIQIKKNQLQQNSKYKTKPPEILIQDDPSESSRKYSQQQQQIDTPKGFGKTIFHNPMRNSLKNPIPPQQPQKQTQIPILLTKMQFLSLDYCMRPVEDIVKDMGKIGVWVEGDLYYGDFVHGRRDGLGLEIFANDEYYYGFFKEDLFFGEGFYFWNPREYFFGKFELGQKIFGRLQGQIKYQGGFKDNKRSGHGTCWYSTGEVYTGSWLNGKKHGKGTVTEPDGSKFTGQWIKGRRKGPGSLETESMKITGTWNEQAIQGVAKIQYANGDFFIGKIGETLEKISGRYESKTGRIFIGEFENDMPRSGQLIYSNGDKYIGELKNLRRHGYGQYYYSTGEVYKGLWQNNIKKQ